jgi:hypothetical protein
MYIDIYVYTSCIYTALAAVVHEQVALEAMCRLAALFEDERKVAHMPHKERGLGVREVAGGQEGVKA